MTLHKTISLIALLLCTTELIGQTIKGRVLDEQTQPMPFANVVILSKTDSSLIRGVITKDDGTFAIPYQGKNNLIRISNIGYKTIYNPITNEDMGDITMQPETSILGEVIVKGSVPKAKIKGASVIMDVENTILSRMGNGDDVLRRIPTVVKTNSGYEVLGKGTPLIYINGRKVQDNFDISNLQSDQIKSIEVIQNPGARYDATISAVIIIKTKRAVGEGLGAEIITKLQQGKGFYNDDAINLSWGKDKLELFANLYGYYKEADTETKYIESINSSSQWTINNESNRREYSTYLSIKPGFSYQLKNGSIGASYRGSYFTFKSNTESKLDMLQGLLSYDKLETQMHGKGKSRPYHLINAYYSGTAGKVSIDANVDYLSRRGESTGNTEENSSNHPDRQLTIDNHNDASMIAEKVVVGMPLWKGKLTLGEEVYHSKREDLQTSTSVYIPSNKSEGQETTIAPFVELSQTLGKWNLNAGLRYEYNVTTYYINNIKQDDVSRYYSQLFPSLSASTSWGNNNQLSVFYSTGTNRPYYGQLLNNISYNSRLLYSGGNMHLKPTTSHNLGLMFMRKAFTFMINYAYVSNDIQESLESYQGDELIMFSTFANYHHRNKLSFNIAWNTSIGVWNPSYSVNLYKQWFTTSHGGMKQSYNKPSLMLYGNNTFNLSSGWIFNLDYSFQSKGHYGLYYKDKPNHQLNAGISKEFFAGKLWLQLSFEDIFASSKDYRVVQSNKYRVAYQEDFFTRNVNLSIRYRINKGQSKYRGTGAGNQEKSRF